jgi:hypothetical protein
MNKSIIIAISGIWVLSIMYFIIARANGSHYAVYAKAIAWFASFLMLVSIIIFVRKWKGK